MLGTEAIYEVIACGEENVEVRVCRAPGLEPNTRLQLSRAAIAAMQQIDRVDPIS